jgi:uncharacterized membrane protein YqjE
MTAVRRVATLFASSVALGSASPLALAPLGRVEGEAVYFGQWKFPIACAFKAAHGVACGTCGMTRAWIALAHGHLAEARALHAEALPTFAATAAVALAAAALAWALWRAYTFVVRAALVALLIAAAIWGSAWAPIVARNRALFEAYASGAASLSQ